MVLRRLVAISKDPEFQHLARQVAQEVFVADDTHEAFDIIDTVEPDVIALDTSCGAADVREFLERTPSRPINIPVVIIGSDGEVEPDLSAEATRAWICAYLEDRRDGAKLRQIAIRLKSQHRAAASDKGSNLFFATDYAASVCMVGHSQAMQETLRMVQLVANSQCNPVLIIGETGTGKELAAKAIHLLRHANERFVAVNCAALSVTLLESELFGHVKGSFTGADREKTGLLELTGSGTILLDEISEMPLDLQAKLLRVVQEKTFRKVGGVENIKCNATIISSSNQDLKKQVRANRFRKDLYYRLNTCPVSLAPLRARDRSEDIPLLVEYFLKTSTICPDKTGKITSLTKLASESLQKHDWPGNVRELRNAIERAILLEETDKIGLSSIAIDSEMQCDCADTEVSPQRRHIQDFSLATAERELIIRALKETGWQKTRAAALLGITRATLYAKVRQYNIPRNSGNGEERAGVGGGEQERATGAAARDATELASVR